jgi:hypothetical protein
VLAPEVGDRVVARGGEVARGRVERVAGRAGVRALGLAAEAAAEAEAAAVAIAVEGEERVVVAGDADERPPAAGQRQPRGSSRPESSPWLAADASSRQASEPPGPLSVSPVTQPLKLSLPSVVSRLKRAIAASLVAAT